MSDTPTADRATPGSAVWFATTRWSLVLAAGAEEAPDAMRALESLCATYWFPLYGWLRRRGHAVHEAQDLTQSFFQHLLQNDRLRQVDQRRGRFRSFLLASLKHFVVNEWVRGQAVKRGGQVRFVSIDGTSAEAALAHEPADDTSPDRAFERSWAATLLNAVAARLRSEYTRNNKGPLFDAIHPYLAGDRGGLPYVEMQARLGMGESAVKMAVLRMRRRFGELLRDEIAHTVSRPEEIDEEIRALFAAVSR